MKQRRKNWQNPRGGGGSVQGMARIQLAHTYNHIISIENLLVAWKEFRRGKKNRRDVLEFEYRLMENLFALHEDLTTQAYQHSSYEAFNICDPKPRRIHKASVRDRVLHHAVYRVLYPFFDHTFIADSFSCRKGKGTHKALNRFRRFGFKVGRNNTRTCWILKCDIRKFFDSIDQRILLFILAKYVPDRNILWLLKKIVTSFYSTEPGKGLPLGNLTSQLLVNIYMNEFDQYVKHWLRSKYYIRYADDFVILHNDRNKLFACIPLIEDFLSRVLFLSLHPNKVYVKTLSSGVDFLGWVHFTDHRILRTATARRMKKRVLQNPTPQTIQSYLGLLKYGNTHKLAAETLLLHKEKIIEI